MELRPYQNEAVDSVLRAWDEGHRKTLLVLPTGCGKTVVFSKVVQKQVEKGHRALILAHRGELLEQAADKLMQTCGLPSVLEKAECSSVGSGVPVTVGSVQTLCRETRLSRFPKDYFSHIVVDEAHHCLSESYQKVLNHFPDANVLGVTATPDRGDHRDLGSFFDSKAYEYSMVRAIREGYLCPIKARMIPLKLDLGSVGVTGGDYAPEEIDTALAPYLKQIAAEMKSYCRGRKTVVFLPLVKTAREFRDCLNAEGFRAVEVNGGSADRAQILQDFASGKYDVLCNAMLLTEGWDCPAVDCVVILRPTKVRSLYQQMVGRGMRLYPGKKDLLLPDFLWMTTRHDLCRPSSLVSKDKAIARRIDNALRQGDGTFDLTETARRAERDAVRERETTLANTLTAMRSRKAQLVDPIQYAISIADGELANYEPVFPWEKLPASQAQLALLEKRGIHPDAVDSAGKAAFLIDKLIKRQNDGLSTPKQIRLLERYGFLHVGEWSFDAAACMISEIAENRWLVPGGIVPEEFRPKNGKEGR